VNTTLLIVGVIFGAVILVAALKAALGPDNKQHGQSDGGSGIGVSYNHHSRNNDDSGDSGGDGGGD
jgi:hypothetical protein